MVLGLRCRAPHTICPASLLQLQTKTKNSKSFIQNQINCECRHLPPLSGKAQNVQHDPVLPPHPLRGLWLPHSLPAGIEQMFSRPRSFISPPAAFLKEYYELPLAQEKSDMKSICREVGAGRATSIELLTPQNRKHMSIRETEV